MGGGVGVVEAAGRDSVVRRDGVYVGMLVVR